jgi:bifunctional DNase/RNase
MILGTEEKKFAIYTEPRVGHQLQLQISHLKTLRPNTFQLMNKIFEGFDLRVIQVVIADVQDSTYFAHLFIEQNVQGLKQIVKIDARPSDSIILALTQNIPLFCTQEVLVKSLPAEEPDSSI